MKRLIQSLDDKQLSEFDRLLPPGGIECHPHKSIWFYDANDIPEETRRETKTFFKNWPEYMNLVKKGKSLYRGSEIGRRFCVYAYQDNILIGNSVFNEILDNPHGYGKDDFMYSKWVFPQFFGSKQSRCLAGDMIHVLFMADMANKIYNYVPANSNKDDKFFLSRVDKALPCLPAIYPNDSLDVQKYISIKQEFETESGIYILIDMDGDIYRKMDLIPYFMVVPGRTKEQAQKSLDDLNMAAEKVKQYAALANEYLHN